MGNRTNNDLQNSTLKANDKARWTPLKTEAEIRCSVTRVNISVPIVTSVVSFQLQTRWKDMNEEQSSRCLWQVNIYLVICDTVIP